MGRVLRRPVRATPRGLGIAILVVGSIAPISTAADPHVDAIRAAWLRREADLESGRIEWVERRLPPAGSAPGAERAQPIERRCSFRWSGGKMAYSWSGSMMDERPEFRRRLPTVFRSVAGGAAGSRHLFDSDGTEYAHGSIRPGTELLDRGSTELDPILIWARPLHGDGGGIDLDDAALVPDDRQLARPGELVLHVPRSPTSARLIVVDPARDHAITRYVSLFNDRVTYDTRIELEEGAGRWVPIRWWGQLEPGVDTYVEVGAPEINVPIDEADFALEFPAGTWVSDQVRPLEYIVLESGAERVIHRSELVGGAKYRDLAGDELADRRRPRPPATRPSLGAPIGAMGPWVAGILATAAGLVLLVGGFALMGWWDRRARVNDGPRGAAASDQGSSRNSSK